MSETIDQQGLDLDTELLLLNIEMGVDTEVQPEQVAVGSMTTVLDTLGVSTKTIEQPAASMRGTAHTTQTVGPGDEDDY